MSIVADGYLMIYMIKLLAEFTVILNDFVCQRVKHLRYKHTIAIVERVAVAERVYLTNSFKPDICYPIVCILRPEESTRTRTESTGGAVSKPD